MQPSRSVPEPLPLLHHHPQHGACLSPRSTPPAPAAEAMQTPPQPLPVPSLRHGAAAYAPGLAGAASRSSSRSRLPATSSAPPTRASSAHSLSSLASLSALSLSRPSAHRFPVVASPPRTGRSSSEAETETDGRETTDGESTSADETENEWPAAHDSSAESAPGSASSGRGASDDDGTRRLRGDDAAHSAAPSQAVGLTLAGLPAYDESEADDDSPPSFDAGVRRRASRTLGSNYASAFASLATAGASSSSSTPGGTSPTTPRVSSPHLRPRGPSRTGSSSSIRSISYFALTPAVTASGSGLGSNTPQASSSAVPARAPRARARTANSSPLLPATHLAPLSTPAASSEEQRGDSGSAASPGSRRASPARTRDGAGFETEAEADALGLGLNMGDNPAQRGARLSRGDYFTSVPSLRRGMTNPNSDLSDLPPPYSPSRPPSPPRADVNIERGSRTAPASPRSGLRHADAPNLRWRPAQSSQRPPSALLPPPTLGTDLMDAGAPTAWVMRRMLHPLRLLAAVPGCIGAFWLLRNAAICLLHGALLCSRSPDGVRLPGALEFVMCSLWSVSTAYHALSFTTLLLRRWLAYYALLSSVIRLVALQAICWPLVRLTLHICGPSNPAAAWVVIGTTTAISDTVARWVTLNIADAPDEAGGNGARAAKRRHEPGRRFWRAIMGAPQADRRTARRGWEADATIAEHSDVGETDAVTEAETDTQSPRSRSYRRRTRDPSSRSDAATSREEEPGRVFHWDVTMRRNVLPVACLGYATMLVLLADSMR
ncbi:hypothetical protein FA09DRAFT_363336 [Tilletiopsis washingtonensis]|uniref:N-glycosylation protein EOS1 n=1 Tax=Tilletiopsis washingtonensis TaxID=58919 RepID=A0A316Z420_9BASI|nr:hypothetical protein FA09DRAFT_363336 [Tilletiopsis washingtonensis]PWN94923.1 hypothetical protein FA09DRAFT_363336 [Tilletiopsis washingtonensis]